MDLSFLKIRRHQKQMILFNVIDVVSKYAWSRIVPDKTQESMVTVLLILFRIKNTQRYLDLIMAPNLKINY